MTRGGTGYDYAEAALKMHRENHGKLEMASKIPLTTRMS